MLNVDSHLIKQLSQDLVAIDDFWPNKLITVSPKDDYSNFTQT